MALHRDIYWVGRQWTVTGYGIQACDQRHNGKFDIESGRLWEDGVLEGVRDLSWLNIVDFEKALVVARKYYPQPAQKSAAPEDRVLGLINSVLKESLRPSCGKAAPIDDAKPVAPVFAWRVGDTHAKFVSQWRIRISR